MLVKLTFQRRAASFRSTCTERTKCGRALSIVRLRGLGHSCVDLAKLGDLAGFRSLPCRELHRARRSASRAPSVSVSIFEAVGEVCRASNKIQRWPLPRSTIVMVGTNFITRRHVSRSRGSGKPNILRHWLRERRRFDCDKSQAQLETVPAEHVGAAICRLRPMPRGDAHCRASWLKASNATARAWS